MSFKISPIQHEFYLACKKGDLITAKRAVNKGATFSGLALGLSATFPAKLDVFRWLLQSKCPINGDTWLYIAGDPYSIVLAKAITKVYPDSWDGAIRAGIHLADTKLIQFASEQIGWQPVYSELIRLESIRDKKLRHWARQRHLIDGH